MSFEQELADQLHARKNNNLFRERRVLESAQGIRVKVDGRELTNFCSNDYLGLANHPDLTFAFKHASDAYGVGGGASHLVCGHSSEHHALEEELAAFTGRDRALLFSTGYMANLGVLQSLSDRFSDIFEDKLNHASLLDGAMLSRAKLKRYAHLDMQQLEGLLSRSDAKRKIIVSDGVFSMDGDCAPLSKLSRIAEQYDAVLMVDDAHGFGCLGSNGGGLQEKLGLNQQRLPVLVGTLGKAFGSFGAFVAGSEDLIETLVQFARSYIYTTSMPPAVAAATRASLKLVVDENWRREKLTELISTFKSLCEQREIKLLDSETPIQPVMLGDERMALFLSEYLFDQGFWISAIRPPTVPHGGSRLRVTLTAEHSIIDVEKLVSCLSDGLLKWDTSSFE